MRVIAGAAGGIQLDVPKSGVRPTMDRVDDTADRVRWNVRAKTSRVVGFIRGLRVVLEELLTTHPHEPRTQNP